MTRFVVMLGGVFVGVSSTTDKAAGETDPKRLIDFATLTRVEFASPVTLNDGTAAAWIARPRLQESLSWANGCIVFEIGRRTILGAQLMLSGTWLSYFGGFNAV